MTIQRQLRFWVMVLVAFVAVVWLLRSIMLPFIAGIALAYMFDPLVRKLQRIGFNRLLGTLTVIGVFVFVFVLALFLLVPIMVHQLAGFALRVPGYVQQLQALAADSNKEWIQTAFGESLPDVSKWVGDMVSQSLGWVTRLLQSLLDGGAALISIASLLVVTPVVAFYILYDWDRMIAAVDDLLPIAHKATIRDLARQVDRALAGFIRGQALVCLTLSLYYATGLTLAGVRYGALIGICSGFISFIPYVGSMSGFLVAIGVAIAQFWPAWTPVAIVAVVFLIGQFLEGNVLYPNLVGESVGLHPVWLMFALFAFGAMMGFTGMLIAVPIAAIIGVLLRFAVQRYKESPVYTGVPALHPAEVREP